MNSATIGRENSVIDAGAFRFVFLACALVLTFGMAFLISMEQRPLKGPTPPSGGATAPSGPATPIPSE